MKKIFLLICVSVAFNFLLISCDPGKDCGESCSEDDDCNISRLICAPLDKICIPKECKDCFNEGYSCYFNTPENGQCDFQSCSY